MVVAAIYAAIVSYVSLHHEPWRDEVVPLSIVRAAPSLVEVWRALRYEGHPILWYACLRYAYLLLGSTAALKMLSVAVAVAAVVVFLALAPLPLSIKCLFTFGWLPLFEYSVVARNYGLGMLCLFVFCALYGRRHPVALALALACLANSNSLGFIMALAAGAMVTIDTLTLGHHRWNPTAVAIYLAGLAFCVATNLPDPSTVPSPLYHHDVRVVAGAIVAAVLTPARHAGGFLGLAPSLWVWLYLLTLVPRPSLIAFAALSVIGFDLVFTLVFPPNQARIGYVLVVVVATMWLDASRPRDASPWWEGRAGRAFLRARRLLLVPLLVTLALHLVLAVHAAAGDVRGDYSSSRRLGLLIESDPRLHAAIVTGEPEIPLQALPYYRDNPIYLPQEGVFRRWARLRTGRRSDFSLSELLEVTRDLRDRYRVPVVIVLGWQLDGPETQTVFPGTAFELTFTTTTAARAEFLQQTQHVASLRDARFTDENYDVFVLW